MDDAVYTFEQILHQSLEGQGAEGFSKTIQRCQDRVIKVRQDRVVTALHGMTRRWHNGTNTTGNLFSQN